MNGQKNTKEITVTKEMRELVIARIDAQVPSNLRLSIGSFGNISKEEMIQHIKDNDSIGIKIVESQMRFLRAQASGKVARALASV